MRRVLKDQRDVGNLFTILQGHHRKIEQRLSLFTKHIQGFAYDLERSSRPEVGKATELLSSQIFCIRDPSQRKHCLLGLCEVFRSTRWLLENVSQETNEKLVSYVTDEQILDTFSAEDWKLVSRTFCRFYISSPQISFYFQKYLRNLRVRRVNLPPSIAVSYISSMAHWNIRKIPVLEYLLMFIRPIYSSSAIRKVILDLEKLDYSGGEWTQSLLKSRKELKMTDDELNCLPRNQRIQAKALKEALLLLGIDCERALQTRTGLLERELGARKLT